MSPRMGNSPIDTQNLIARERDRFALEMRLAGETVSTIAERLQVTPATATKCIKRSLALTVADIADRAHELRAMESGKLDVAAQALWAKVVNGDTRAQTTWLRNRQRYADLLGLDIKPIPAESGGLTFVINTALPWERPGHPDFVQEAPLVLEAENVVTEDRT